MEARLVQPHVGTEFHHLVGIAEHHIGRQGDVALRGDHDLYLDAPFDGPFQGFLDTGNQGEVRVDEFDGVLCIVDGMDIELAHDLIGGARLTVDDAHHLIARRLWMVVFGIGHRFVGGLLPDTGEDLLQVVHGRAFDPTMHITPFAHLFRANDIVVGHVHAACVGRLAVDDHDLTVVTGPDMVYPRESDGVELHDVDTVGTEFLEMVLL